MASLENENVKVSYISVALNKDDALKWITQIKLILWRCCEYLDNLKPDVPSELHSILLLLHTLVSFTSISTWRILHTQKSIEQLKPGMVQLCANIMGHLFMRGFYLTLKVFIYNLMKYKMKKYFNWSSDVYANDFKKELQIKRTYCM